MMRALAEFIMRGRIQAVSIALIGSWFPLLTQATLGLVTLRKGWQEGFLVTLWASLPVFLAIWVGDVGVAKVFAGVAVICVSYVVAGILRATVSWSATLAALVAFSMLSALLVTLSVEDLAGELSAFYQKLMVSPDKQPSAEVLEILGSWTTKKASGVIALWVGFTTVAGLFVARWWQAILFNPGGFQSEFHSIRLTGALALASGIAVAYCDFSGAEYQFWGGLFRLPLLVAGLGIAHCAIAKYKMNVAAVVILYIALFIFPPIGFILSLIGLTDAWLNYRKRFNLLPQP
ncbi:hypothetical protein [Teredinibacter sp. KSP-S5-2]|uniref:hypothetical protein n=1 Tax=Teredinibacter sp. KSP-S5-2 TaxID=3034506 RepID=UPI002934836F|nr:hypothetical protein [Teredinibacter sp. KSP-S5-2]WNO08148.1 hypothetical protein P5V12_14325 [Teredinibacter sp. KSP-S5-2]